MKKQLFIFIQTCFLVLSVKAQIAVNFIADTTIVCPNYPIQFTDISVGDTVFNWHWDFGDGTIDSVQNPSHAYTTPGFYTISLTASSSNDTQTKVKTNYIHVRDFPQALINYLDTIFLPTYFICFVGSVANNDGYFYKYYWNFDNTGYGYGDSIKTHLFDSDGTHTINLMVYAGAGCRDTSTLTITIKDTLGAPNIFTPNNDNQNDLFIVKTNGYNNFTLDIFNRWGVIVYSVTAKYLQWDGYSSAGVPVPAGVYYYHVTSPDIKGYKLSGKILLIR